MIGWEVAHVDELDAIAVGEGVVWHPVRRKFGIRSYGVNAYTSERVGELVIEDHDESGSGAGGHEELYLVVRGLARFTVGGESLQARSGTLVYVRDPALRRSAIAEEQGTLVLAIGGEPGRAYQVSAWEASFAAFPALRAGRWYEAIELMQEGLREHPDNPSLLYNLACAESLGGRSLDALLHLQEAVRAKPDYAERARNDPDFDPIRGERGFPA